MFKTLKLILERHLQILEHEIELMRHRNIEAEFIYEDYKDIAEITYKHPFGSRDIKTLVEGCANFLDVYGGVDKYSMERLKLFLKDTITINNYRDWLNKRPEDRSEI